MNKLVTMLGLAALSGSFGLMAACSSSSSSGDTGGTDSGSTDSAATTDSGAADSGSEDSGGGDEACQGMSTKLACEQCCNTDHTAGATVLTQAVVACGCEGTGLDGGAADGGDAGATPCLSVCATTLCAATQSAPSTECNTCLQGVGSAGGVCVNYVATRCTANTDCVAEQTCFSSCPN